MKPKTVDEYIKLAPEMAQEKFKEMRSILSNVAPTATEVLKWGKPILANDIRNIKNQLIEKMQSI